MRESASDGLVASGVYPTRRWLLNMMPWPRRVVRWCETLRQVRAEQRAAIAAAAASDADETEESAGVQPSAFGDDADDELQTARAASLRDAVQTDRQVFRTGSAPCTPHDVLSRRSASAHLRTRLTVRVECSLNGPWRAPHPYVRATLAPPATAVVSR